MEICFFFRKNWYFIVKVTKVQPSHKDLSAGLNNPNWFLMPILKVALKAGLRFCDFFCPFCCCLHLIRMANEVEKLIIYWHFNLHRLIQLFQSRLTPLVQPCWVDLSRIYSYSLIVQKTAPQPHQICCALNPSTRLMPAISVYI